MFIHETLLSQFATEATFYFNNVGKKHKHNLKVSHGTQLEDAARVERKTGQGEVIYV
jgi:hypothetical protein